MSRVLDQLQRELVTEGRIRPVVDVLAPALSSPPSAGPAQDDGAPVDWTSPTPQLVRSRKEQRRLRYTYVAETEADRAGAACACGYEKGEMCGIHARLGHRRHVRPA
jgi:hypothetical protein